MDSAGDSDDDWSIFPGINFRTTISRYYCQGRPYDKGIDFEKLSRMTENYVSSDIELIVTESARIAVAGNYDLIDEQILISAIQKLTPSISVEEIEYFEQFSNLSRF